MSSQIPTSAPHANAAQAWAWGKSLGAAAWPLLCAIGLAVYAFFPRLFPQETGFALVLLIPAEIPALVIGLAHAAALAEATLRGRLLTFFVWVGTAALLFGFGHALELSGEQLWQLAPILFWVLVPYVVGLVPNNIDPKLASRQAEALISDRLTLLALIPAMVIGGVLVAIGTLALLALISIALGIDLVGKLGELIERANPSLFALAGSAYMLLGAASAGFVHTPEFLRQRKNMLDRPWILKLIPPSSSRTRP